MDSGVWLDEKSGENKGATSYVPIFLWITIEDGSLVCCQCILKYDETSFERNAIFLQLLRLDVIRLSIFSRGQSDNKNLVFKKLKIIVNCLLWFRIICFFITNKKKLKLIVNYLLWFRIICFFYNDLSYSYSPSTKFGLSLYLTLLL